MPHFSIDSPILITLTIAFGITSAITTFDVRLIQAKRLDNVPKDEPMLPMWVGLIHYLHYAIAISILLLNWKYAIVVFIIKFALDVLPVLETIGNVLMSPFRPRQRK